MEDRGCLRKRVSMEEREREVRRERDCLRKRGSMEEMEREVRRERDCLRKKESGEEIGLEKEVRREREGPCCHSVLLFVLTVMIHLYTE